MRFPLAALLFPLLALVASAAQLLPRSTDSGPKFVSLGSDGRFSFNGSEFPLIGTTAYWLSALNTDDDIDSALGNISKAGFNVVRTWAFNDVTSIPVNGTWFQLISNGTTSINNDTNGLQKLDTVIRLAQKHNVFVILSLTNNWNPQASVSIVDRPISFETRDTTSTSTINATAQRNFLSNQYGGMDTYVRELGTIQNHDQFYVNETLINAFKNYTTQIVSRYVNSPVLLSWEVANDPRCNSSLTASPTCRTTTVTKWHSIIARHIKSVDPNHLVSSGVSGYFCLHCPKLFQKPTPTSPPRPSTSITRRALPKPLTKKSVLAQQRELLKRIRVTEIQKRTASEGGIRIRGRWLSTQTKRQSTSVGPAFDGSTGVDSADILSDPEVNFGSAQLFPNQNIYGLTGLSGQPTGNESLQIGLNWIQSQADSAASIGKPVVLTGFGVVTQNNAQAFTPFNTTTPVVGSQTETNSPEQQSFGVSDNQRDSIYQQWIQAALQGGLSGVIQYQWGQGGLSVQPGTPVGTPANQTQVGTVQNTTGVTGNSPNDGYSVQGIGAPQFVQTIQQESQTFGATPP